jgi:hypothetical protein
LQEAEFIQVSLAKASGLFMKHTNYTIFSKRQNKTVTRRYSDFEPLDAYLRKVYPYRIIPAYVLASLRGQWLVTTVSWPVKRCLHAAEIEFCAPAQHTACHQRHLAVATKTPSFLSAAAKH